MYSHHKNRQLCTTKVVGIMGFDLSAMIDAVEKSQLLPKLAAVGTMVMPLDRLNFYLSDWQQCISWNGVCSKFTSVYFKVWQGKILGILVYLVHVAHTPSHLNIGNEDHTGHSNDSVPPYMVFSWYAGKFLAILELQNSSNRVSKQWKVCSEGCSAPLKS